MPAIYHPLNDISPMLTTIVGVRTTLRPLTPADFTPEYVEWFRDEEFTRFLGARNISASEAEEHLSEGIRTNRWAMLAITLNEYNRHIGNVKIGPVDWQSGVTDLVTVIGDRTSWGKGLASETIQLAGDAIFTHLSLRKLSGAVVDGNAGSIKAYYKAGWEVEGRLKGHVLLDGEPRDRILISRFNPIYFPQQSEQT